MFKLSLKSLFWIIPVVIVLSCGLGGFIGARGFFDAIFGEPKVEFNVTTVLERIQGMSRLTTVRYTFSNIVEGQVEMPPLLAGLYGQGLAMVAVGYVDAGIDLDQLNPDNVTVRNNSITVRLPAPQIQNCFFDESESYVVSRSTGVFAQPLPNLEGEARRIALGKFTAAALEQGILEEASGRTEVVISELLTTLVPDGYSVLISADSPDRDIVYPASCG